MPDYYFQGSDFSLPAPFDGAATADLVFPSSEDGWITIYGGSEGVGGKKLMTLKQQNGAAPAINLSDSAPLTAAYTDPSKSGTSMICGPYPLAELLTNIPLAASGGSASGSPGTITGKVETTEDGQLVPAARKLVAVEVDDEGTWSVTGDVVSDALTGQYTLNVTTGGGDTYVIALDDYGQPFTPNKVVVENDLIHPSIPNGYVYKVLVGGTLPASEPDWWIDTGTNNTQTVGDVTLRAMAFYRPLCHGPLKATLTE